MARCGCVDTSCTCVIRQGDGILLDGGGDENNPLQVSIGGNSTRLVPVSSAYMTVNISGQGSTASPFALSIDKTALTPPDRPLRVAEFLTPGTFTWDRPTGVTVVEVIVVAGGDGGGGGGSFQAGLGAGYGLGGAGGQWFQTALSLDPTCTGATVTVGSGGASSPPRVGGLSYQVGFGLPGGASEVVWTGWAGSKVRAQASSMSPVNGYEGRRHAGKGGDGAGHNGTPTYFPPTLGLLKPWEPSNINRLSGKGGNGGYSIMQGIPPGESPSGTDGQFPGGGGGGGGGGNAGGGGGKGGKGANGAVWIVML